MARTLVSEVAAAAGAVPSRNAACAQTASRHRPAGPSSWPRFWTTRVETVRPGTALTGYGGLSLEGPDGVSGATCKHHLAIGTHLAGSSRGEMRWAVDGSQCHPGGWVTTGIPAHLAGDPIAVMDPWMTVRLIISQPRRCAGGGGGWFFHGNGRHLSCPRTRVSDQNDECQHSPHYQDAKSPPHQLPFAKEPPSRGSGPSCPQSPRYSDARGGRLVPRHGRSCR